MSNNEIVMRIAGESGEGVISTGDIFTQAAARSGHHVLTFRTYPAEIKGGHAWFQVRVGDEPVLSIGDRLDVLVAFNAEGYENHIADLKEDGVLIYDPDTVTPPPHSQVAYAVAATSFARRELDFLRGKNLVFLGVLAHLFGLDPSSLEGVVRSRLGRRAELLEQNLSALLRGFEFGRATLRKADPYYLTKGDNVGRLVLSGNDALVAAALLAGCRFYAGYPITPASDIMEAMARELPMLGGVFMQAEDEIAAIAAVVGAAYSGAKAMTATSGPGLSLMTEVLGLAAMAELPCVVVDSQRAGPSTGMPTKMEQGDLNLALFGAHGDVPRIVVAPSSVEDCLYETVRAFNLAEKYQMPVILLTDQSLAHRTQTMLKPDFAKITVVDRLRAEPTASAYQRFALTDSGISPIGIPGCQGTAYVAPGLEHDEYAHPRYDPHSHTIMTEKRFRKLETAAKADAGPVEHSGAAAPEIGVIGWGSSQGPIREAVAQAEANGYRVAALYPKVLNPLPVSEMRSFATSVKHLIVPESNYMGQFANHLGATFGVQPIRLNKYGGIPFTAAEIRHAIEEVGKK